MKLQTRQLQNWMKAQSKASRLAGKELEESRLLDVLNKWPKEPACVRLAQIIGLIKWMDNPMLTLAALMDPDLEKRERERERNLNQLNMLLERYPRIPTLAFLGAGHWRLGWANCNAKDSGEWESKMAHWIAGLASSGLFSRVSNCRECLKWFYARTAHQRYCSESCRKKCSASSPAFKAKRARYMREKYRPLQKQLNERSLKQVAKGKRG